MNRLFALSFAAGAAILTARFSGADEPFAVNHTEQVTVRILSGRDGQPIAHVHLVLTGGYDERELHDHLWQEEAITDAHGQARLSKQFANLPWLRLQTGKARLCQANPGEASYSVELMLRDGLSTPNRCGTITVEDRPGVFTVFVKDKKSKPSPAAETASKTAPTASPAAVAPAPRPVVAPVVTARVAIPAPKEEAFHPAFEEPMAVSVPVIFPPPAFAIAPAAVTTQHATRNRAKAGRRATSSARRVARRTVRKPRARTARPACRAPRTPAKPPAKPTATPVKAGSKPAGTGNKTAAVPPVDPAKKR
jgi:hypothetical protein